MSGWIYAHVYTDLLDNKIIKLGMWWLQSDMLYSYQEISTIGYPFVNFTNFYIRISQKLNRNSIMAQMPLNQDNGILRVFAEEILLSKQYNL